MNSMQQEMQHQENRPIRQQFINMEQEPVHPIFQYGPDDIAQEEAKDGFNEGIEWYFE
jgi:hypothetical protein